MGLPNTLAGNIGLIVFVVFILAYAGQDLFPGETQGLRNSQMQFRTDMNTSLNTSIPVASQEGFWAALAGVGNAILNFFSMIVSFIIMIINYEVFFLGIAGLVPAEFYILFFLLQISTMVSIILLIALAGK